MSGPGTRARARTLLDQLNELLAAAETGQLPVGAAYRHRIEGGITALEAVLGLPPSMGARPSMDHPNSVQ